MSKGVYNIVDTAGVIFDLYLLSLLTSYLTKAFAKFTIMSKELVNLSTTPITTTSTTDNSSPIDSCPICYDEITNTNVVVTECNHKFHTSCLMNSVSRNGFGCPLCRGAMKTIDDDASDSDESEYDGEENEYDDEDDESSEDDEDDYLDPDEDAYPFEYMDEDDDEIKNTEEDNILYSVKWLFRSNQFGWIEESEGYHDDFGEFCKEAYKTEDYVLSGVRWMFNRLMEEESEIYNFCESPSRWPPIDYITSYMKEKNVPMSSLVDSCLGSFCTFKYRKVNIYDKWAYSSSASDINFERMYQKIEDKWFAGAKYPETATLGYRDCMTWRYSNKYVR